MDCAGGDILKRVCTTVPPYIYFLFRGISKSKHALRGGNVWWCTWCLSNWWK